MKAVREKFEEFGLDARAFAGLKIAAVGGVTAAGAARVGHRARPRARAASSPRTACSRTWPPFDEVLDPINRVFLPRADIATDTLVAGLQDMGWEVDDVTAYRTVRAAPPAAAVREAIKTGRFDAVVFTSSSTVRNLVGIAGKPHPSTVVAVHRPGHGQDRRGARPAGRRPRRRGHRPPRWSTRWPTTAWACALAAAEAGEPVVRPSAAQGRRPGARRSEPWRFPTAAAPAAAADARRCAGWSAQTRLHPAELVLPVFVREGADRAGADRARCPASSSTRWTRWRGRPARRSRPASAA